MHITDTDSKIPKRSRSNACKFPCNTAIRSTNFKDFHYCKSSMNNYIDRFAVRKGWKKGRNKLNSVSRHALSVSRAPESEVLVHSCRTACSVAQH